MPGRRSVRLLFHLFHPGVPFAEKRRAVDRFGEAGDDPHDATEAIVTLAADGFAALEATHLPEEQVGIDRRLLACGLVGFDHQGIVDALHAAVGPSSADPLTTEDFEQVAGVLEELKGVSLREQRRSVHPIVRDLIYVLDWRS